MGARKLIHEADTQIKRQGTQEAKKKKLYILFHFKKLRLRGLSLAFAANRNDILYK